MDFFEKATLCNFHSAFVDCDAKTTVQMYYTEIEMRYLIGFVKRSMT